jgi:2-polyprenyl-3-methyl-5-hydroxy-6-metoxy-1,4-benzoquinol methylase
MKHSIVCPVCGANKTKRLFEKQGSTFVQCLNDELVYIDPQPDPEELQEVYDHYGEELFVLPESIAVSGDYPDYRKRFLNYRQTNRLLELGAAAGGFLLHCRKDGWDTYGVELSTPSSTFAREQQGLNVFTGTIHEAAFTSGSFDVIVAWQTLEHVPNPKEVVVEIFRLLRSGGFFVMSVPCWNGLSIRLLRERYRYVGRDHLFYFSSTNLVRMLMNIGFSTIRTKTGGFNPFVWYQDKFAGWGGSEGIDTGRSQRVESTVGSLRKRKWFRIVHWVYASIIGNLRLGDTLFAEALKA